MGNGRHLPPLAFDLTGGNTHECTQFTAVREAIRVPRIGSFTRLKQGRGIATRYDKAAESYRAAVTLASLLMWA
ncbi:hypothetical protein [Streptomyces sp. NPDC101393]|uniref:hypothetical protein n=1 Tax=Streptomyces sp. NPDC101393 TaxID=3366141 RepID=UPI00382DD15A